MPTVEIDGRRLEVEDGITVIQAAERLGIEIPHYCWHPGLSISGNCRMCLVEIEKQPKLQIACNTRVADGMVVLTQSDRTKAAQRAVQVLLDHLREPDTLAAYSASDGLCLPHLRRALAEARPRHREAVASLAAAMSTRLQGLEAELAEYVRKHDYRFRGEAFGEERAAPARALARFVGERGAQ